MTEQNPFTLVYETLWETLLASERFSDLVRDHNRVRFDSRMDRDPMRHKILTADLPELVLSCDGTVSANMHQSSCSSSIVRRYSFLISTGDMRVSELMFPIEWAVFCALVGFKEKLAPLTWRGFAFVKDVRVTSTTQGLSDPDRNRGIKGWSAVWQCEIGMHFPTHELLADREI